MIHYFQMCVIWYKQLLRLPWIFHGLMHFTLILKLKLYSIFFSIYSPRVQQRVDTPFKCTGIIPSSWMLIHPWNNLVFQCIADFLGSLTYSLLCGSLEGLTFLQGPFILMQRNCCLSGIAIYRITRPCSPIYFAVPVPSQCVPALCAHTYKRLQATAPLSS